MKHAFCWIQLAEMRSFTSRKASGQTLGENPSDHKVIFRWGKFYSKRVTDSKYYFCISMKANCQLVGSQGVRTDERARFLKPAYRGWSIAETLPAEPGTSLWFTRLIGRRVWMCWTGFAIKIITQNPSRHRPFRAASLSFGNHTGTKYALSCLCLVIRR